MPGLFHNYDPAKVVVTFRGIQVIGFMSGTFVSAERTSDSFETTVGSDGDVTRVRKRDSTGMITITLQAESPSNDLLSAAWAEDEAFGTGYGPVMVKDLLGTTLLEAPIAWIQKPPMVEYADTASGREWPIACHQLIENIGGSVV